MHCFWSGFVRAGGGGSLGEKTENRTGHKVEAADREKFSCEPIGINPGVRGMLASLCPYRIIRFVVDRRPAISTDISVARRESISPTPKKKETRYQEVMAGTSSVFVDPKDGSTWDDCDSPVSPIGTAQSSSVVCWPFVSVGSYSLSFCSPDPST